MPLGKCPSCEKMVTHLKMETLEARVGVAGPAYHAVSYLCPWCNVILGAGLDPVALKADTVNKVGALSKLLILNKLPVKPVEKEPPKE